MKPVNVEQDARDLAQGRLAHELQPILRKEFTEFYMRGVNDTCKTFEAHLHTLRVNIANDKLTDTEFRTLMETMHNVMMDSMHLMKRVDL